MNKTSDLNINNNPKTIIILINYRRSLYQTRSSWFNHRASNITNKAINYQCLIWSRDKLWYHRNNNIIKIIYSHKRCSCRIRVTTYKISITKMAITILGSIIKHKRWRFSNTTTIKMVVKMSKILCWCLWMRWKRLMKSMARKVSIPTTTIILSRITIITLVTNPPLAPRACQQLQVNNQHHQYQLLVTIIVSWMIFAQSLPNHH